LGGTVLRRDPGNDLALVGGAKYVDPTGNVVDVISIEGGTARARVTLGVLVTQTPKIAGTARKGKKLTAKVASWGPLPVRLKYQWLRNGRPIEGATKRTYVLKEGDVAKRLVVKVTGSKNGFAAAARKSRPTVKVRK
jgi:hypothetical protein